MQQLYGDFIAGKGALGVLLLRFVAGAGLLMHGLTKIRHPFDWMGAGSHVPGFLQGLAVLAEVGGGLALIAGLLTLLAALGIVIDMACALMLRHIPSGHPFVAKSLTKPSFELAALYLVIALMLLLVGPGQFSLDAALFGKGNRRIAYDRYR